ncbi:amino acid/amide ABC transporter ATP-binding protein 1, HAAT family [Methanospirillum hungatei JF-1]|uniref:Amino acid/amide ABC transporter ATP-binding protein 1, HAAT family n=1 Tax=Methanospirillum hungatei JF-1 (strain ATCC 27890 / DSM 864 / NBRC 100397 / JF-1) TaxID=323259 RepID=Q2FMU0_METHJ|nr:ABC transporter ATP-binding protein [Methanospirillum hungatei]ABD40100.1 amino acid/amide ABC transporter ATP-binding protein 1, HAAT family [Methanospirillum hungatei JF-1]
MLNVKCVSKSFGGLQAVRNVDMTLREGEILGLVGPNGAGKTTLLNMISGVCRPDAGGIYFEEENITRLTLDAICKRGIAKTFQHPRSFPGLSAKEGVLISALYGNGHKPGMKQAQVEAIECLQRVGFPDEKLDCPLGTLNTIDLRKTQLARALASKPKMLLLDEIMTGLTPSEGKEAIKLIRSLRDEGLTILMIEHVMKIIMEVSDRVVVLDQGEKIAEGTPREVAADERVIESYLGEQYHFQEH